MNSKKKLIITAAAFVIIIIVAVIAYNTLKSRTGAGNLNPLGNHAQTETSSDTQKDSAQDDSASGDAQKGDTQSGTPAESETEANPIPEFSMTDANGKTVSISDLFGKPTVINFWSSTCPYCIDEMPYFQEMYETYGEDINFVMLDIIGFNGETEDMGRSFIEEQGYSFPVYYDTQMEATYTLGLRSLPMTLFLDSDGNMTAMANGRIDKETIQKGIDMIQ